MAVSTVATSTSAAEFQTGQAARAVIGQSSFSAREEGITPTALSLVGGRLYAADGFRRLLTFDLSQLPGPRDEAAAASFDGGCGVCGFAPVMTQFQPTLPGLAGVSSFGKTVVAVDTQSHRVFVWRDASLPRAAKGPDIILGRTDVRAGDASSPSATTLTEPISVAFDGKRLYVGDTALHRVLIWNSLPASDTQPADVVLGQQSFSSASSGDSSSADSIARPSSLAADGTNLYVGDAAAHRILVFSAADVPLAGSALLNSASSASGAFAPGSLVTIASSGLVRATEAAPEASESMPDKLGGAQVLLNGRPVPMLSADRREIRVQLPYDLDDSSSASLVVRTERDDGTVSVSNAVAVRVLPAAPGLFAFGGPEPRSGMTLHAMDGNGQKGTAVTPENPARPGEVVIIWAAGLGAVNDSELTGAAVAGEPSRGTDRSVIERVSATVSGRPAEVVAAALPTDSIGIYQLRIALPADFPEDTNAALVVSQDGYSSNTVTIPVQRSLLN